MPPQQSVALLFGNERHGMRNEDVYRCHLSLYIPTQPGFGSLNLASAVQVVLYAWRQVLGGYTPLPNPLPQEKPADTPQIQATLEHWAQALAHTGYLHPEQPGKLMLKLQTLLLRAQPTEAEIHILRGMAKSVLQLPAHPRHPPPTS